MALGPGVHLGPYEILSAIGAGGMGEVYRARDTRLDRTVAIKILPEALADNPQFRDRFDREARAISQLTHPNICTLFDLGHEGGTAYLVLEYLEGSTLEDRLKQGALPLDQALTIATQIADALNAAHRQGIVHRDLKPGNVMLTKSGAGSASSLQAKLLDFGLAKTGVPSAAGSFSMMPTTPPNLTQQGTILGTFQYMAPEQLEGEEADARTDIFAFGAMLYEMIAGRKAFEGKSQASLISAIMTAQPRPLAEQQPLTPPALDYLVATCLKKDSNERWQTVQDLLIQLRWVAQPGNAERAVTLPTPPPARGSKLATALLAVAALLVLAMAVPAFLYFRTAPPAAETIRFELPTPVMPNAYQVSISPDGRHVAFVGQTSPAQRATAIFVRDLGSATLRQLAGTDGATQPFWSPDSQSIAFTANGGLRRIDIAGGPPLTICSLGGSGTWNQDGTIVFGAGSKNILEKVPALGGEPTPVTSLDQSQRQTSHYWPFFLPDGHHFLYTVWAAQESNQGIFVGSLDSPETVRVSAAPSMAMYASPGYLLYQRDGTLFAQSFDAKRLRVSGEPVRVADQVPYNPVNGRAAFAVSQTGVLVYRSGTGVAATQQFVWFDRDGKEDRPATEPAAYTTNFDLSLDGKQIALSKVAGETGSTIWVTDWARGVSTRITFDSDTASRFGSDVVLSPDGQQIAYSRSGKGSTDIYMKNTSGLGQETVLSAAPEQEWVEDWSKDNRYLVYSAALSGTASERDLRALPLFGDRKSFSVVKSQFPADEPHFSFDTKWLAYASLESGTWQVNVVSFPAADQKRQLSNAGGSQPRWRRDGRELYYLALDGKMMAVEITVAGSKIESGTPRALFDTGLAVVPTRDQYAVTPDGQRFLVLKPVADAAPTPITVTINWHSGLVGSAASSR